MLIVDFMMDFLFSFKSTNLKPDIAFSIKTIQEHRFILRLLEKRDADKAREAMFVHLGVVGGYLVNNEISSKAQRF
jgi:DNA-binding GntR family transcriptional regulator